MQPLLQRIMRPCTAAFLPPPPPPSADIKGRRIALNGRYTPEYHTSNSVIPAAYKVAEIQHDYHNSDSEVIISNNNVADSAAMDVRLRGYDGISFANFYKQKQIELFSALDNAFAVKAENALADYDSIKSAQVRLQSELGGRQAQLGIDVIGAISERADRAVGWQMHIYVADGEDKGASGGLFYRRIQNEVSYGVNVFADYEKHEYGDFYRYGVGGEIQNRYVGFAANYYIPLTEEQRINSTLVAFSREGYDANLQIAIPGASFAKAEAAYYYYDGKGGTEEEKGFRYGAALSPGGGIILKVFYDDGGEEFGGEISYRHTFGEVRQVQDAPSVLEADLFAPVKREHSQRIAVMTVGGGSPSFEYIVNGIGVVGRDNMAAIIRIPAGYFPSTAVVSVGITGNIAGLSLVSVVGGRAVVFNPSSVQTITATVSLDTVPSSSLLATSFVILLTAVDVFSAMFATSPGLSFITGAINATVGMISGAGGLMPYSYRAMGDVIVNSDGVVLFDVRQVRTITAQIIVSDSATQTPDEVLVLTLAAFAGAVASGNAPIIVGVESPIATIVLPNGRVDGSLPSGFVITNNTIILFSTAMAGGTTLPITITNAVQTVAQTIMLTARAAAPIGGGLVINSDGAFFLVGTFGSAIVATLTPTGGSAPNGYSLTIQSQVPADFILITANAMTEVRFSKNGAATVSATIIVDDDNEHTTPLSLFLTATAVQRIAAMLDIDSQSFLVGDKGTVGTLSSSGGLGAHTYLLSQPAGGFALESNTVLAFSVNAERTESAMITVDDGINLTPPVVISITVTSVVGVGGNFVAAAEAPLATGILHTLGSVSARGGSGAGYVYRQAANNPSGFGLSNHPSGEIRFSVNTRITATATMILDDDDAATPPASVEVIASVGYFFPARNGRARFTVRVDGQVVGGVLRYGIGVTEGSYGVLFPADDGTRPIVITAMVAFGSQRYRVFESNFLNTGENAILPNRARLFTLTVVDGSAVYD